MKLRRSSKATQKAIAEDLGVSVMTVSRALRNHPDLSEETKSRIVSRAIDLGYDKIPQQTEKAAIKRVGLFLYEDSESSNGFESGVRRQLFFAIEEQCQKQQVEMVLQFPKSGDVPVAIRNKTVDAVFLMGRYTVEDSQLYRDIPTLAISSFTAGAELPSITADNQEGARLTTQHLIAMGHRDILFVGKDESSFTELFRARSEGYILAMEQSCLDPKIMFFKSDKELISAIPEIRKWTALVCACDSDAIALKEALAQAGIKVPLDISITGFDNLDVSDEAQLTTYSPDWAQLGNMAVNIAVHAPELLERRFRLVVPGKIIMRKSTSRPMPR